MKSKLLGLGALVASVAVLWPSGVYLYTHNKPKPTPVPAAVCIDEEIPFESKEVEAKELEVGDWEFRPDGVDGSRRICTLNGLVTSNTITLAPVNQIKRVGSYVPEPEYEETEYQGGSVCRDGWHSPSVGQGACSWHGGVAY